MPREIISTARKIERIILIRKFLDPQDTGHAQLFEAQNMPLRTELTTMATDRHPDVRSEAVGTLRYFLHQADIRRLVERKLEDQRYEVRASAAMALTTLPGEDISNKLGNILRTEPNHFTAYAIIQALAQRRDGEARRILIDLFKPENINHSPEDTESIRQIHLLNQIALHPGGKMKRLVIDALREDHSLVYHLGRDARVALKEALEKGEGKGKPTNDSEILMLLRETNPRIDPTASEFWRRVESIRKPKPPTKTPGNSSGRPSVP